MTTIPIADHQSPVDEPCQVPAHGTGARSLGHPLHRGQIEAGRERGQLQQQPLFRTIQQGPGVLEHTEEARLAGPHAPLGPLEQLETLIQAIEQLVEAQLAKLRGRQLQGQRQAVETPAHRGDLDNLG